MFHWICPECGREIAPTLRECPACDPVAATVETALAGEVEAPARARKEAADPALRAETPGFGMPAETLTGTPGTAVASAPAAVPIAVVPTTVVPSGVVPVMDPPPAFAARVDSVSPLAAQGSQQAAEAEGSEALLPQLGAPAEGGDPLDYLGALLDTLEPEPPAAHEIIPLAASAVPTIPAALRAFIADLRPAGAKASAPLTPPQPARAAPEPALQTSPAGVPLRSTRPASARPLGAKLLAFPAAPGELVRPNTPPLDLAPPLAPLGKYSPLEGRPLRPAPPKVQLIKKEFGPRTTLPGPMLTHRLVKFMDRELKPILPRMLRPKRHLIPGWMASALIIGTVLGAGVTSLISFVRPAVEGKQITATEAEAPAPATAPIASPSPLAKAIEVTGFRIQLDPARKSEIQYLVVNHTPARFNGVMVYVTLYAADAKAGQPPLCKFQFTAPNLAPYQAKDMTSAIEQVTRPVRLPEWQDLRASVEIGQ